MNILFLFCEGGQDVQFLRRILIESKDYASNNDKISDYVKPFPNFFKTSFFEQNIDALILGEPQISMLPSSTLKKSDNSTLIIFYQMGGSLNKLVSTLKLLEAVYTLTDPVLKDFSSQSGNNNYSILFFFDADDKGKDEVFREFCDKFSTFFGPELESLEIENWKKIKNDIPLGVFIFTEENSNHGTIEDTLISIFKEKEEELVNCADDLLVRFSNHQCNNIAQRAKKNKSVLSICGQKEKKNAGYSLSVIIKNSSTLNGAFVFNQPDKIWDRIIKMINSAF